VFPFVPLSLGCVSGGDGPIERCFSVSCVARRSLWVHIVGWDETDSHRRCQCDCMMVRRGQMRYCTLRVHINSRIHKEANSNNITRLPASYTHPIIHPTPITYHRISHTLPIRAIRLLPRVFPPHSIHSSLTNLSSSSLTLGGLSGVLFLPSVYIGTATVRSAHQPAVKPQPRAVENDGT
jgi:hypothetical protein